MSKIAQLKKKAADYELKKQFDKAIATYVELLQRFDEAPEEIDVALFNRVGDLMLKQGQVADAVDYYERAVDLYTDGGFFNNAIALCNKILRQSPGRASVYYKLGKISAQKGFKSDAKRNFLEYADRMQKSGRMDEAFRALKEFADLCPDQEDVRLMLAEQLARHQNKVGEAVEQLQVLYQRQTSEGRAIEARATLDRIKAIDPSVEPTAGTSRAEPKPGDLVFLDLDAPIRPATPPRAAPPVAPPVAPPAPPPAPRAEAAPPATAQDLGQDFGADSLLGGGQSLDFIDTNAVAGLDTGGFGEVQLPSSSAAPPAAPSDSLLDFEPTSFGTVAPEPRTPTPQGLEFTGLDLPSPELGNFAAEPPAAGPQASAPGGGLDLIFPDSADAGTTVPDLTGPLGGPTPLGSLDEIGTAPTLDWGAVGTGPEPGTGNGQLLGGVPLLGGDDATPLMDFEVPEPPAVPDEETRRRSQSVPAFEDEDLATALGDLGESEEPAAPSRAPSSTMLAAMSVESLEGQVEADPTNSALRQQLGEALLESGERERGLDELDQAMIGFERANDLFSAASTADEIVRVNPDSVRHHQKRVEYAFRMDERARLVDAYLELAGALMRSGAADKSRTVYQRVLDLAPDDVRAQAALSALAPEGGTPVSAAAVRPTPMPAARPAPAPAPRAPSRPPSNTATSSPAVPPRKAPPSRPTAAPLEAVAPAAREDDSFVNLGDWLRDDAAPRSTRMVVEEQEPTGDEEADFADMLRKFKQGVAENVDDGDHQAHYDLGIAFKEMGLVDEAIAEFQKALRSPTNRVPTYEALGQCFLEKEQYQVAATLLARALGETSANEEQLIGVLYLLGRACEGLQRVDEALAYYQRVFVLDIQFRDVSQRLTAAEKARR